VRAPVRAPLDRHRPVISLHVDGHVDALERARLALEQVVIRPRGVEGSAKMSRLSELLLVWTYPRRSLKPALSQDSRPASSHRSPGAPAPSRALPSRVAASGDGGCPATSGRRSRSSGRRGAMALEPSASVKTVPLPGLPSTRLRASGSLRAGKTRPPSDPTVQLVRGDAWLRGRTSTFRVLLLQRAHDRGRRRVGGGVGVRQGEGVGAGDLDDPRRQRVTMLADVEVVAVGESGEHAPERAIERADRQARLGKVVRAPRREVGVEEVLPRCLAASPRAARNRRAISAAWSSACAYPKPKAAAASVSPTMCGTAERVAADDDAIGQRPVGVERDEESRCSGAAERGGQQKTGGARGEHGGDDTRRG